VLAVVVGDITEVVEVVVVVDITEVVAGVL
jgi:hypothetical protein